MEKQRPLSDVANTLGIMDRLSERCLKEAGRDGRFEARKSEYHFIESIQDAVARHDVHYDSDNNIGSSLPHLFTQWRLRPQDTPLSSAQEPITFGCLKCVFQGSRPQHVSGRPDILPFRDAEALRHVFTSLQLPTAYLQIADGSPALAKSHITYNHERLPCMYEIVVHCVAKQGDWAMALSHKPATKCSSLFWSVDKPIDSELLLEDLTLFREYAFHPMLTPCIMFAATLRAGVERRHSIKKKLGILEDAIRTINLRGPQAADRHYHKTPYPSKPLPSIESLFELLNSCRGEQASREGRYEFWRSYHEAINEGFEYAEQALTYVPQETFSKAQSELKQWNSLVWRKLESLRARDIDHITRVNNISDRVCANTVYG